MNRYILYIILALLVLFMPLSLVGQFDEIAEMRKAREAHLQPLPVLQIEQARQKQLSAFSELDAETHALVRNWRGATPKQLSSPSRARNADSETYYQLDRIETYRSDGVLNDFADLSYIFFELNGEIVYQPEIFRQTAAESGIILFEIHDMYHTEGPHVGKLKGYHMYILRGSAFVGHRELYYYDDDGEIIAEEMYASFNNYSNWFKHKRSTFEKDVNGRISAYTYDVDPYGEWASIPTFREYAKYDDQNRPIEFELWHRNSNVAGGWRAETKFERTYHPTSHNPTHFIRNIEYRGTAANNEFVRHRKFEHEYQNHNGTYVIVKQHQVCWSQTNGSWSGGNPACWPYRQPTLADPRPPMTEFQSLWEYEDIGGHYRLKATKEQELRPDGWFTAGERVYNWNYVGDGRVSWSGDFTEYLYIPSEPALVDNGWRYVEAVFELSANKPGFDYLNNHVHLRQTSPYAIGGVVDTGHEYFKEFDTNGSITESRNYRLPVSINHGFPPIKNTYEYNQQNLMIKQRVYSATSVEPDNFKLVSHAERGYNSDGHQIRGVAYCGEQSDTPSSGRQWYYNEDVPLDKLIVFEETYFISTHYSEMTHPYKVEKDVWIRGSDCSVAPALRTSETYTSNYIWSEIMYKDHPVVFKSEGTGQLRASINGVPITSGAIVPFASNVDFVATPATGGSILRWQINENIQANTPTNVSRQVIAPLEVVVVFDVPVLTNVPEIPQTETESITVSPNPVTNHLTINSPKWQAGDYADVFDVTGRFIARKQLTSEQTIVNMSSYPIGIYLIRIGNQTIRVIKE
jgi:hypothetical protein